MDESIKSPEVFGRSRSRDDDSVKRRDGSREFAESRSEKCANRSERFDGRLGRLSEM